MTFTRGKLKPRWLISIFAVTLCWSECLSQTAQCPWSKELIDLHSDCICATNAAQRLSIQCSPVNFTRLLTALKAEGGGADGTPIDLLYAHNATVPTLEDDSFIGLDIQSLHLARCGIETVSPKAFQGLTRLTSLNLQDNKLTVVPNESLRALTSLKQLDLSNNRIARINDGDFEGIPLTTLKLADNKKMVLSDDAFRGLEGTLKNLNMKGMGLETIPKAVGRLSSVAFLDLAQNQISSVGRPPGGGDNPLNGVSQLTALNLERNRIARLDEMAFYGVNTTLSSLSLLNNLLVEFPEDALKSLGELRVLDLGFNGIRKLPKTAFSGNTYLTLLALDGNPMASIPEDAFRHLNSSLRGLSIGGSYLICDCRIKWLARWVRASDLQVTSRERNPQFCSQPEELRRKTFAQINPEELICTKEEELEEDSTTVLVTSPAISTEPVSISNGPLSTTNRAKSLEEPESKRNSFEPSTEESPRAITPNRITDSASITVLPPSTPVKQQRVTVKDAYRRDSTVTLQWDTDPSIRSTDPVLGFRVLYRFFGEREFRRGPRLNPSTRNFTLEDLPGGQCLVACVVEARPNEEEIASANRNLLGGSGNLDLTQCQEVRTERIRSPELDTIVIAASASVCGVIILAVVLFLCCFSRRRSKGKHSEKPRLPPTMPLHVSTVPAIKSEHEWESLSVYSGRSIPRARMYHQGPETPTGTAATNPSFIYAEDTRSHLSVAPRDGAPPLLLPAGSHVMGSPNGVTTSGLRSTADGQSHRSYSQLSTRFASDPHLAAELSKSQQSLSHMSYAGPGAPNGRSKPHNGVKKANGGRMASSSSLHSLTEYESDWTAANTNTTGGRGHNWKDLEVDIYVGQNHVMPNRNKYR